MPDKNALYQQEWLIKRPPRVRFSEEIQKRMPASASAFRHIEFMMSLLEAHPLIPFDKYTFGSDYLDFRRALAYEIALRQLAHLRSATVNANIMNRPGIGVALRCSLEMYGFVSSLIQNEQINDERFIERLLAGRTFYTGSWYDIEKAWKEVRGEEQIPEDTKKFMKQLLGTPPPGQFLDPVKKDDKGFNYLYARYSAFEHQGFSDPRMEWEHEIGNDDSIAIGSDRYYHSSLDSSPPEAVIERDISALSFCLEMFWPKFLDIDPFLNKETKKDVVAKLAEQGMPGAESYLSDGSGID